MADLQREIFPTGHLFIPEQEFYVDQVSKKHTKRGAMSIKNISESHHIN